MSTKMTRDKDGNMTYEKGIEPIIPVKKKSVALKDKKTVANTSFDLTASDALRVIADAADKAANKIDTATEKAATLLANAADKATTALASAAKDVSTLLASNASEAMKVSNIKNEGDHDLLIRLEEKLAGLKLDIKELKDGNGTIKILEKIASNNQLLIRIGGAWLLVITSIVIFHLFGIKI